MATPRMRRCWWCALLLSLSIGIWITKTISTSFLWPEVSAVVRLKRLTLLNSTLSASFSESSNSSLVQRRSHRGGDAVEDILRLSAKEFSDRGHISPGWTRGRWIARKNESMPYSIYQCTKTQRWIGRWNRMLAQQMNYAPAGALMWQPGSFSAPVKDLASVRILDSSSSLKAGPWLMPTSEDMQRTIQGRTIAFFGDSIGGQQSLSFALLLFCPSNTIGFSPKFTLEGSHIFLPSANTTLAILQGGQFLGFSEIKTRTNSKKNYFINDKGEKVEIKDKKEDHVLDVRKTDCPRALMAYLKDRENVTLIINSGRWFGYKRYDVVVYDGDHKIDFAQNEERLRYYTVVVRRLAQCLEANFAKGSYAVWIGVNPRPAEVDLYCGEDMHPWTKPISDGIKGFKRSFLIDMACAGGPGQKMQRRSGAMDIHWMMPGVPDLTNAFVLRLMHERALYLAT